MWRLCRWLIGRNLFWNSIVNKPHINLVALALTIQRKMHLHGIKSSYKPCPFIHVNRIFYFEKIVFIDGGRTAEKDDDFISGKKIRYFDPWWPWWTSSNSPQEFSLKDFFAIRIKILWWWPEIVVNLNWTCKIFSRYRRCCCFFEVIMQKFDDESSSTMFCTSLEVVSSMAGRNFFARELIQSANQREITVVNKQ